MPFLVSILLFYIREPTRRPQLVISQSPRGVILSQVRVLNSLE
eukprot:UN11506